MAPDPTVPPVPSAAQARAFAAYERARWRDAVVGAAPLLAGGALAVCVGDRPFPGLCCAVLLVVVAVLLRWRGRDLGAALGPGLIAGAVPLSLALLARAWGHVCVGGSCVSLCFPACAAGGVIAGLYLSRVALRRGAGVPFLAAGFGVAMLVGALGCSCVGFGGALGMAAGLATVVAPSMLRSWVARRA